MAGQNLDSQPDFSKLFLEYFAQIGPRVSYVLRRPPNIVHDGVFLSSLIHDARVVPSKCRRDGDTFTMLIDRDKWEEYRSEEGNLDSCPSSLVVTAVENVEWSPQTDPDEELWIDYLWIDESFRYHNGETFGVILAGDGWRLIITVRTDDVTLKLEDE